MKRWSLILGLFLSAFSMQCKKDVPPKEYLEGWWNGDLYEFGKPLKHNLQMSFSKNYTVDVYLDYNLADVASGTYTIQGDQLELKVKSFLSLEERTYKGKYNRQNKELTGTWGLGDNHTTGGTWIQYFISIDP